LFSEQGEPKYPSLFHCRVGRAEKQPQIATDRHRSRRFMNGFRRLLPEYLYKSGVICGLEMVAMINLEGTK
jgi:hypothetical protein